MKFFVIAAAALTARLASSKAVFAHFMVSNTLGYNASNWETEIEAAQTATIDAFALNLELDNAANNDQVPLAFQVANEKGFKLFFSFDYAANGAWSSDQVSSWLDQYCPTGSAANGGYYLTENGECFVSTFEGYDNAPDWSVLKQKYNVFFIPDYSSRGALAGVDTGVTDGLFNWGGWPDGPQRMMTTIDASYKTFLGQSNNPNHVYMMPVSPWFYTNLPGFSKNWLWNGDHLWHDRWNQVFWLDPDYVEIITWNDWGESHYIGPLPTTPDGFIAFDSDHGAAPFNYAAGMDHDGWRAFLPYLIATYKSGVSSVSQEGVQVWHRPQPILACNAGGTTGNNVAQSPTNSEYPPSEMLTDQVFFSALLGSDADVRVTIGGVDVGAQWHWKPFNGVGIYHGNVSFFGHSGEVVTTVSRGGTTIASHTSKVHIDLGCVNSYYENFNAYAGGTMGPSIGTVSSGMPYSALNCTEGAGDASYGDISLPDLCGFACQYTYCPWQACTCWTQGLPQKLPPVANTGGYPIPGASCIYEGLCSYDCNYGHCPGSVCTTDSTAENQCVIPVPTVPAPPDPSSSSSSSSGGGEDEVCVEGNGPGNYAGLCSYSCNFGFCVDPCTCTRNGTQVDAPALTGDMGFPVNGDDSYDALCAFACSSGYCPPGSCTKVNPNPWPEIDVDKQVQDYLQGLILAEYEVADDNVTASGIRLVGFNGCDSVIKTGVTNGAAQIWSGLAQVQKIMNIPAIKKGSVDFNSAAALEYLGAPGLNRARQGDMNAVFKNFGTLQSATWPFGWRIEARCDDYEMLCPCGVGPGTLAYTKNKGPNGIATINFCKNYFLTPTIDKKINNWRNAPPASRDNMNNYWESQAQIWAHELMHIDWVALAEEYGHNSRVWDLEIYFKDENGLQEVVRAYRPLYNKILARYPRFTGDHVLRNADNLATFLTSMYVQQELGEYPHYPICNLDPNSPPFNPTPGFDPGMPPPWGTLFSAAADGSVLLNMSNPLAAGFNTNPGCDPNAGLDTDEPKPDAVGIDSFAPNSEYPDDYISSVSSWLAAETQAPDAVDLLGAPEPTPTITATPSPMTATVTCTSWTQCPTCPPGKDPICIGINAPSMTCNCL